MNTNTIRYIWELSSLLLYMLKGAAFLRHLGYSLLDRQPVQTVQNQCNIPGGDSIYKKGRDAHREF